MIQMGMILLVAIAVAAVCSSVGVDNTSRKTETGHDADTTARNGLPGISRTDERPPGDSAAIHVFKTLLPSKAGQSTKLSNLQINLAPNTGKGNETGGSGTDSKNEIHNVSLAVRNPLVDRRSDTRSQHLMNNSGKDERYKRSTNVLSGNISVYTTGRFNGRTREDSLTRMKKDESSLLNELPVEDVGIFLTHDNNDSVPAVMSVSGVVNNDSSFPAVTTAPGFVSYNTSIGAVMSVKGVIRNSTSAPTIMTMSGIVSNKTILPAVRSVKGVISNDTIVPIARTLSKSVINETHQKKPTLDNISGLHGMGTEEDDLPTFSVQLDDFTFTVCSELSVCRHRCPTLPTSTMEGQRAVKQKRQADKSHKQLGGHNNASQNMNGNDELENIDFQRRQKTKPTHENEKETQGNFKKTLISQKQRKTKQISQQNVRRRTKRSGNGNMPDARCTNNSQNYTCFCDDSCVLYGDCCVDVFQSCFSKTNTTDILNIIYDIYQKVNFTTVAGNLKKMLENNPENTEQILGSFVPSVASCEKVDWNKYVYLVSLCPAEFSDMSVRSKCEIPDTPLLPPVMDTFSPGSVSFKNIYCAQCHGFDRENLQPWLANLDCYKILDKNDIRLLTMAKLTELVASKTCNVSFTVPPGTCEPRICEPTSQLSESYKQQIILKVKNGTCSQDDAVLCQTYITGSPNRNPSCSRCLKSTSLVDKQEMNVNLCNITNPYTNPEPTPRSGGWGHTGGILIILDITGKYSEDKEKTTFYVCADDEVFDLFFLQCKTLICPSGFEPFRGDCIDSSIAFFVSESSQIFPDGWSRLDILTNTSETSEYISCGQILESTEATVPHKNFILDKVLINDYKDINDTFPENISTSFFRCEEHINRQQSNCLQSVDLIMSMTQDISLDTIEELELLAESLIPLRSDEEGYQISISNMLGATQKDFTCTYGKVLAERSDFSLVEHKGIAYVVFNHTQQGVYYPLGNIGYELTIAVPGKAFNTLNLLYKVYICQEQQLLFRKNCSVVVYLLNETQQEGTRLLVQASGEYYNEGDFYTVGDQVYVCSKFKFEVHQESGKESTTYIAITCVFTCLSVACLLIMIIIYCVFPELQSLPGKMSATLAGTMMLTFLANLFTLTKLHNDYICPVLAAISHVITLSHFGWMAAISVNMTLTFGPGIRSLVKSCSDKKVYVRYSLVVWGLSLAIVLTSVILDFSHRKDNSNPHPTADTNETVVSVSALNYPRYGDPFCTWFSGPLWARLSFVVVPYFITYIISTTGFLLTLAGIHRSNKNAETVGNKTAEKTLCLIYIKLSTAMGFAWILSLIVGIYPDSEVLPYIYLCLVLLQGVLLFLAFTVNRKVYSLIMKKYFSGYTTSSKDGTQISSVMTNTL